MLLTEQEVDALRKSLPAVCKHQDVIRAAESAVLEKLKAQESVGEVVIFDPLLELFPKKGPHKIIDGSLAFIDSAEIGTKLYTHPLPPADVVRDAERYRWLVDNSYDRDGFLQFQVWKHSWEPHSQTGIPIEWKCRVRGPAIDAAIDAAMKEE